MDIDAVQEVIDQKISSGSGLRINNWNLAMDVSDDAYTSLRASLLNISNNVPLHERFRALFTLKSLKNERAIEIISEGEHQAVIVDRPVVLTFIHRLGLKDESALLKHELSYCLGQMGDDRALPVLQAVLADVNEDPMVRHEVSLSPLLSLSQTHSSQAAEAMGAISSPKSMPFLKEYLTDSNRSVRETCEIALARIEWAQTGEGQRHRQQTRSETQ